MITTSVMCLSLLVPNGTVVACVINCPGCMHDSMVCDYGQLYEKLEDEKLEEAWNLYRAITCVDLAFCHIGPPCI